MNKKIMRTAAIGIFICIPMLFGAQTSSPSSEMMDAYARISEFKLGGASAHVENFDFVRDALRFNFTGDIYFAEPVSGVIYGAVFVGQGRFRAETVAPWEEESVRRFLNGNRAESTFTRAVIRFSDDTAAAFAGKPAAPQSGLAEAQRLTASLDEHLLRETGLNVEARLLLAAGNRETPGIFLAEMDGGSQGRFTTLLDHQMRIPATVFGVNGGEKSLTFKYEGIRYGNDIWSASYSQQDIQRGLASYADAFDLIQISNYKMNIDLLDPGSWLRMEVDMDFTALGDGVRVIPLRVNEGLGEAENARRDKASRIVSAEMEGRAIGVIQEQWESGATLVLPSPLAKGQSARIRLKIEGKDSLWSWGTKFHYPRSTSSWYPRHGYLTRSRFNMVFHHDKSVRIASTGRRVREGAEGNEWITEWATDSPEAFVTFVCGPFQRHAETFDVSGRKIPIEYYSPPGNIQAVKEDFILAEMGNALTYFDNLFGQYPHQRIGGAYFPTSYGQGFPTLLLLPVRGYATPNEFSFLAHENAHQWWGNIVRWRSYRDQWLSEGFADYSGVLYTGSRSNAKDAAELLKTMRLELMKQGVTSTGVSKTQVYASGPLTLGTRLSSSKSLGGYEIVYSKGALVLRMLHFLLSSPDRPGDDAGFFAMMKDFVNRHRESFATSESFMQVASEHFARSPIAQKYGMKDLRWFLDQWVYQAALPSYHMDYTLEARDGGGFTMKATVLQTNVPENWIMILPIQAEFSGGRIAKTTVHANGPKTAIEIRLPEKPQRVRLDPDSWILSGKTSEKG